MAYIGPAPANSIIATSDIEDGAVTSAKLGGNIVTPGTLDVNGQEFILDADADSSITADTDDQVDIKVGGTDVVTLTNSSLVLKGTTPTLTIGDAGAEDTKIVFDGNAQDFYIGLDDTDDDFKIGLGSAVGTTAHIVIDETGAVTKPLQPCVFVTLASAVTNFSINTEHTILWGTEVFDVNGDMSGSTFTAPVTGKYLMNYNIRVDNMDSDATNYYFVLAASNRSYYPIINIGAWTADISYWTFTGSWIVDMDTSDTFLIKIRQEGGTAQTDLPTGDQFLTIALLN
jgi:hypothetical protein